MTVEHQEGVIPVSFYPAADARMAQKPGVRKLASLLKRKADFIEPMDCAPVSKLPDGSQWLVEIKLDGYRAIAVKSDRRFKELPPAVGR